MSVHVSSWVWRESKAAGGPLLVLLALADQADDDGQCWPRVANIVKRCRVSRASVMRHLETLRDLGELTWESGKQAGKASVYRIVMTGQVAQTDTPGVSQSETPLPQTETPGVSHSYETPGVSLVRHRNIIEPSDKEPTSLRSVAQPAFDLAGPVQTAQTLVGEWVDHCQARPPGRVVGQIAKEVDRMLGEGIPYTDVRTGLQQWQARGLHPSVLASVVHEMRTAHSGGLKSRRQLETDAQFGRMMERAQERDRARQQPPLKEISS